MVKLLESDILTREVLEWDGVHLFHFHGSSCSQKTRIFFNLKEIEYESHLVDLVAGENHTEFYLGINPRGLVPTLVVDGEVHIESNDIILFADKSFPGQRLIPPDIEKELIFFLRQEDDLHLDIRTITFRFTQPRGKVPRSSERLDDYRRFGTGKVQGQVDPNKERELRFWQTASNVGITDEAVQISAEKLRRFLDELDVRLETSPYLMGSDITVLDVAWVIYVNRLIFCGYPLEKLHPRVDNWFWPLREKEEFKKELIVPPELQKAVDDHHQLQKDTGTTLIDVAGL